jgi:hypothetical protein
VHVETEARSPNKRKVASPSEWPVGDVEDPGRVKIGVNKRQVADLQDWQRRVKRVMDQCEMEELKEDGKIVSGGSRLVRDPDPFKLLFHPLQIAQCAN